MSKIHEIKPKIKMTEQSEEIFANIENKLDGKRKININENKSETLQKMEDFYINEEKVASELQAAKEAEEAARVFTGSKRIEKNGKIVEEVYENGAKTAEKYSMHSDEYERPVTITKNLDPQTGRTMSEEIRGLVSMYDGKVMVGKEILFEKVIFDPKTGRKIEHIFNDSRSSQIWTQVETFDENSRNVAQQVFHNGSCFNIRKFEKDGNTTKSFVQICSIPIEKHSEAMAFLKKYDALSDVEIQKLYQNNLQNSNGISELEFRMIEGLRDMRLNTLTSHPRTSDLTQIAEHHHINGQNTHIRNFLENPDQEINGRKIYDREIYEPKIKEIDEALSKLPPLEKDCIFYRGLSHRFIPQVIDGKIGDIVIPDTAYAYTAFNRELAIGFGDKTILVIKTPKGAKISRNAEHGGEALFPRNAEYKILSKNKSPDGHHIIELEYILPKEV